MIIGQRPKDEFAALLVYDRCVVRCQRVKVDFAHGWAAHESTHAGQVVEAEPADDYVKACGRPDLVLLIWLGDKWGLGPDVRCVDGERNPTKNGSLFVCSCRELGNAASGAKKWGGRENLTRF